MPNNFIKFIINIIFSVRGFCPKCHLFKSALLCQIAPISTEQDLLFTEISTPSIVHSIKIKRKKLQDNTSIHGITISKEEIEYTKSRNDNLYYCKEVLQCTMKGLKKAYIENEL